MMFGFSYLSPAGIKERFDIDPQTLTDVILPELTEGVHYVRTPGGHVRVCVEMFADWLVNQSSPEDHGRAIENFRDALPSKPQSGRKKSGGGARKRTDPA